MYTSIVILSRCVPAERIGHRLLHFVINRFFCEELVIIYITVLTPPGGIAIRRVCLWVHSFVLRCVRQCVCSLMAGARPALRAVGVARAWLRWRSTSPF